VWFVGAESFVRVNERVVGQTVVVEPDLAIFVGAAD
jgi:hypothetical protein